MLVKKATVQDRDELARLLEQALIYLKKGGSYEEVGAFAEKAEQALTRVRARKLSSILGRLKGKPIAQGMLRKSLQEEAERMLKLQEKEVQEGLSALSPQEQEALRLEEEAEQAFRSVGGLSVEDALTCIEMAGEQIRQAFINKGGK